MHRPLERQEEGGPLHLRDCPSWGALQVLPRGRPVTPCRQGLPMSVLEMRNPRLREAEETGSRSEPAVCPVRPGAVTPDLHGTHVQGASWLCPTPRPWPSSAGPLVRPPTSQTREWQPSPSRSQTPFPVLPLCARLTMGLHGALCLPTSRSLNCLSRPLGQTNSPLHLFCQNPSVIRFPVPCLSWARHSLQQWRTHLHLLSESRSPQLEK